MARSVIDLPAPDGPRIAIRWLAAWCATRSRNVPTVTSRSKLTDRLGRGVRWVDRRAAWPARRRCGSRISAMSSTTMATPSASAVGAWVVGMPVEENCT